MSYNNVLKSFTDRGPNKRKVKPVEAQMLNFSFGGSDSEEDEDFRIDDNHDDSGSDGSREDSDSGSESSKDDSDSEEEEEQKDMPVSDLITEPKSVNYESKETVGDEGTQQPEKEKKELQSSKTGVPEAEVNNKDISKDLQSLKKAKLLVCGICLEHRNSEEDELIQCDACGMIAHEGCYGDIGDEKEDDDSDSDSPTEPWFCDSCKANASPSCELCPVSGGIFKQTDTGKWVHLVCALYTPGVGFRDVTSLQTVVLEDVQVSKWGAKECLLCEDSRFCKTGICIGCDAGLCKSHFHVTCAQRNGLLSEIPNVEDADEDMADPLYAHCKQHADSNMVKSKIRSWLSYLSEVKKFKPSEDQDERIRMSLALNKARAEYREFRRTLNPPLVPKERVPRFLSSCPEACQKLTRKAEMLGYSVESAIELSKMLTSSKVSRTINPTLSCEFINYFYHRESKLKTNNDMQDPLIEENEKLKVEQLQCQTQYEVVGTQVQEIRKERERLTNIMNALHKSIETLLDEKLPLPGPWLPKTKAKVQKEKVPLENIIHTCFRCKGINDQHLMTDCDVCHNYYHLSCCIPPLTRMPKKSTKYLWQCYECDPYESEEEEEAVDTGDENMATRRPRRNVVIPSKFDASMLEDQSAKNSSDDSRQKRPSTPVTELTSLLDDSNAKRKRGRPRKTRGSGPGEEDDDSNFGNQEQMDSSVAGETEPVAKKPRESQSTNRRSAEELRGKREKPRPVKTRDNCWACKDVGDSDNLVKCDECGHSFHFKTCLNPPYTKTPKRRGYGWICVDCDKSSDEEAETDIKPAEEEEGKSEKKLRSRRESAS